MKSTIKLFLKKFADSYRAIFSLDLTRMVGNYQIPTDGVLHIGGNRGQEAGIYNRLGFKSVLWVEGLPDFHYSLEETIAPYPEQKAYNIFATDQDFEDVIIRIANTEGSSTLLEPNKEFENIKFIKEEHYKARRIDNFFSEQGVTLDDMSLLVLDVEGYELRSMRGMGKLLGKFDWILTEISIIPNYVGGPTLRDIDQFLINQNYERIKTWVGLFSGDALYRKVDKVSAWAKLRMATTRIMAAAFYYSGIFHLKRKVREAMDRGIKSS